MLDAILELARELSPATVDAITAKLEAADSPVDWTEIARLGATAPVKEHLATLAELIAAAPNVDAHALALAIQASANAVSILSGEQHVELAWTGPATEVVPLRRVDQVIYELVESAQSEVILVTYAAYKAERALDALRVASERGVRNLAHHRAVPRNRGESDVRWFGWDSDTSAARLCLLLADVKAAAKGNRPARGHACEVPHS